MLIFLTGQRVVYYEVAGFVRLFLTIVNFFSVHEEKQNVTVKVGYVFIASFIIMIDSYSDDTILYMR